MTRTIDSAQYLTWIHALQNTVILPDYHAPWLTEPALWNPFFLLIARASSLTHIQAEHLLHLVTFVLYLFTAFALSFALRSFMPSRREAFAAILVALCVVPLSSNLLLPMLISWNGNWRRLPGLREFTWTHDGFLHGLLGDPLVTLGTGAVLVAMGCLACYVRTGEIRYLYCDGLATFFAAALHPFEVWVIVSTSIAVIAWQHRAELSTVARRACIVCLPAALAVSPYALVTVLHPWFEDFAKVNRWHPGSFTSLFLLCGLPLLLVAVLSFVPWKSRTSTDFILQWWLGLTIFCMYVPWAPFGRHFFDGFHYVTAMLLVRQVASTRVADLPWRKLRPGLAVMFLGVCFLVSFSPHLIYRMQAYIDGNAVRPRLMTNALTPEDEAEAIKWLGVKAPRQ
jgi:hypothetical protein